MKSYSIGRDMGCDIVMNDNTDVISRRHAVLTVSSSGKMTITDQSSNGTYVNGIKISPNVAVPVTRKDSISFAHVATLDWNMIPKSTNWITYLIVGLVVAAIAAILVLLLTREKKPDLPPTDNPVQVVDTVKPNQPETPETQEPVVTPPAEEVETPPTENETPETVTPQGENPDNTTPENPAQENVSPDENKPESEATEQPKDNQGTKKPSKKENKKPNKPKEEEKPNARPVGV
jgi:predicted component of type VI protein secretion system